MFSAPLKKGKVKKFLEGEDDEFVKFLEKEDPQLLDFEDEDLNDSEEEVYNELENGEPESEFVPDENQLDEEDAEVETEFNYQSISKGLKKWTKAFESSSGNLSTCVRTMRAFCKVKNILLLAL